MNDGETQFLPSVSSYWLDGLSAKKINYCVTRESAARAIKQEIYANLAPFLHNINMAQILYGLLKEELNITNGLVHGFRCSLGAENVQIPDVSG